MTNHLNKEPTMNQKPYDEQGKFVKTDCPRANCGAGSLKPEGDGTWRCDGLATPKHDDLPLVACDFTHQDGQPYNPA
jgi:hypothetical protein